MATGNLSELEVGGVNNGLIGEETGNHELEDSFEDIDLDNLNENQSRIDSVLKFLLNFNVPKKSVGRPKKTAGNNVDPTVMLNNEGSDNSHIPSLVI